MAIYRQTWTIANASLGGTGTNTWHCETAGAVSETDTDVEGPTAYLVSFYGALGDLYPPSCTLATDGLWTSVHDDGTVNGQAEPVSLSLGPAGSNMPPQDCLVCSWRTATASRRARGRTFIGPLALGCLEANGTPAEWARTALQTAMAALVSDSDEGTGGKLGVYSSKFDQFRPFTGGQVRNKFGSLRSRRD